MHRSFILTTNMRAHGEQASAQRDKIEGGAAPIRLALCWLTVGPFEENSALVTILTRESGVSAGCAKLALKAWIDTNIAVFTHEPRVGAFITIGPSESLVGALRAVGTRETWIGAVIHTSRIAAIPDNVIAVVALLARVKTCIAALDGA